MKIHDESMKLLGDKVEEIEELKKQVTDKDIALTEAKVRIAKLEELLQAQK